MKRFWPYFILLSFFGGIAQPLMAQDIQLQNEEITDSVPVLLVLSDPVALFDSMPQPVVNNKILNLSFKPKVFSGYHKLHTSPVFMHVEPYNGLEVMTYVEPEVNDSTLSILDIVESQGTDFSEEVIKPTVVDIVEIPVNSGPNLLVITKPEWLEDYQNLARAQEDLLYSYMIDNPTAIEFAYWDLPTPPVLISDDPSFIAFLNKQEVPEVKTDGAILPEIEVRKKYWLHTFNTGLQFSQAFVSPNWYQGGNNYLALLFNFGWNVNLNQVYHPNILFQSDLSYKLALSSNPSGSYHKYSISEDLFQYNLNAGLKAIKNWYYSFNLQFKTQLFNNFEQSSDVRTASFLSPGDLNIGLGMSYNHKNKLNTFEYTLSISPISYNLKTCISDKVNHETYNIPLDKKTKSEVGSNLEFKMNWKITANITYNTRMFMFTDYHYLLTDWQNTFSFDINKFLSTQLFVHLRYDGSADNDSSWKKFMMREILSFGLSYTFSTKPK